MAYQKHIWITKEIIRREYLQNIEDGIYNEEQRAIEAEGLLSQSITDEHDRAYAKENLIAGDLSDEVTRATNKENQISGLLTDEVTRATGAESDLSDRISNEYTRATGVEASLQSAVSSLETRIAQAYKAGGSILFADLPPLTSTYLGYVYNIKDDFTTTADFLEGAGVDYPLGTNVAIVSVPEVIYHEITPVGDENPSEQGWYEYDSVDDLYFLSEDTEVDSGKTYYTMTTSTLYYDVMVGSMSEGFYLEQDNISLSTSAQTTVTFTDARILATSTVEAYTTVDGIEYAGMVVSAGSCVMTFDEVETAITISVKIWVR